MSRGPIRCDGCGEHLNEPAAGGVRDPRLAGPDVPPREFDWCVRCARTAFRAVFDANLRSRQPIPLPVRHPADEPPDVHSVRGGVLGRFQRRPGPGAVSAGGDDTVVLERLGNVADLGLRSPAPSRGRRR